jgi:DNA primase
VITQHTIQQIQNRIDIIEIVGEFVRLKKRGANYLGLCPFHNEKTPSFTVSPSKEIYKCFGCGKSGNTISFLMEHEKYSYVEALRWLANKYNVEIEETESSPEQKQQQLVSESLYIINSFAQKYFSENLFNSEEGQDIAHSYLRERGFNDAILHKFQIGYCLQEKDAFAKTALAAQYNPEYLQRSGLVVMREEKVFDNYRGRIIFPVHNQTGKIIGFGARIIGKNDRAPKYINTPENELYVKSRILYGSYFARQAIDRNDECLLVEGYTDVISLHQAGIENVVASGGTSLTQDQLRLIKKYTNNLTIIYDGDSAGVKAALRGLDMALEEGLNVKLVLIPDKEDPDSYVNKVGASAFRDFIQENKKDFILFQLEVSLKDIAHDSAKKSALVNQVAETISRINKVEDFTKQQDYIKQCAEILRIEETGLNALVNKFIREKVAKQEARQQPLEDLPFSGTPGPSPSQEDDALMILNRDEMQERALVRCLIEFGIRPWMEDRRVADYIFEESVDYNTIDNRQLVSIMETYKIWYDAGLEPGPKNFLYHEDQDLGRLVLNILDFPYELSANWTDKFEVIAVPEEEYYRKEVFSSVNYLKLRKIKRMIDENQKDLEKPHSPEEQIVLIQTHKHLKEMEKELVQAAGTVILK